MLPKRLNNITSIVLLSGLFTFAVAAEDQAAQNKNRARDNIAASQPDEPSQSDQASTSSDKPVSSSDEQNSGAVTQPQSSDENRNAVQPNIAKDELAVEAVDGSVAAESYPNELVRGRSESGQYIKIATPDDVYQTLPVEAVEGQKVVNLKAKAMGKVGDVVVNEDGTGTALIVKSGGFLGIGETEMRVPIEQVYIVGQQLVWETREDSDEVKDMERYKFDEDRYTSLLED